MRDGIDAATNTAISSQKTKPLYLLEMGFDSPVRLSSRITIPWAGNAWLSSDVEVSGSEPPSLSIFNDGLGLGAIVLAQGTAGRAIKLWEAYATPDTVQDAPAGYGSPVLIFSGQMSDALVADRIAIQCKLTGPLLSPRGVIGPPVYNHLPAKGTKIKMPSQIFIIE